MSDPRDVHEVVSERTDDLGRVGVDHAPAHANTAIACLLFRRNFEWAGGPNEPSRCSGGVSIAFFATRGFSFNHPLYSDHPSLRTDSCIDFNLR